MRLVVLGSGSRGNCAALVADDGVLLVEAGFSAREVERRAAAAGVPLERLVGIVLTHEHGDHASGAVRLATARRVPLLASPGTLAALGADAIAGPALSAASSAACGPFLVRACPTSHDAAEPLAVAVTGADGTSVGFATDLGRPTTAVKWLLRGHAALVLEANHDEVLLRESAYPPVVQQRIAGAGGHLSNHDAASLLGELVHDGLAHVVLAHLSERCNSEAAARTTIEPALRRARFRGALHVARQEASLGPLVVAPPPAAQLALTF
ncbi:MAG: MBL fold metallo-hydrolase [Gemmatimonadales bacterium]|nr:MBL fold metallo-hydrolase [Gemmatimonadales bacterium]